MCGRQARRRTSHVAVALCVTASVLMPFGLHVCFFKRDQFRSLEQLVRLGAAAQTYCLMMKEDAGTPVEQLIAVGVIQEGDAVCPMTRQPYRLELRGCDFTDDSVIGCSALFNPSVPLRMAGIKPCAAVVYGDGHGEIVGHDAYRAIAHGRDDVEEKQETQSRASPH